MSESTFDYLTVLSMPQVSNSSKSLLFHGGDTGSIPVRDAITSGMNDLDICLFTLRLSLLTLDQLNVGP